MFYVLAPANRGRKSPVPSMVSTTPYHTLVGDPDLSWYFGLDPELKFEDLDQPGPSTVSTVEVQNVFIVISLVY